MSATTDKHKADAPRVLKAGVVTVSDSKHEYLWSKDKALEETEDVSGKLIVRELEKAGHEVVFYTIIPDHEGLVVETVDHILGRYSPDIVVTTGGTGVGKRDVTVEALASIFDKSLEGFGEFFRKEGFERLGSAALLSRAVAGVCGETVVFALPGSPDAVATGVRIIIDEAPHLVKHVRE